LDWVKVENEHNWGRKLPNLQKKRRRKEEEREREN